MEHLRRFLVELYRGSKERYVHARYALVVFDLVIIVYFVVTTFLPPYSWIAIVDLLIGTVLLVELLARALIERDRINFLLQPWTILDIVVIASLLIPAMTGSFVFLRVLRALRLMRSYFVVRELRRHSKFFARNEEIIFSALNLLVFVFIVSATVYVLQAPVNSSISNYVDALYFTITTLTTTGFGDITLTGTLGRLLSVLIMVVGVTLFLRVVQTIVRPSKVRHECPDCGLSRHDPDAVHCKHCGRLLHIDTEGV
jgi:voltage-gated potassium channel